MQKSLEWLKENNSAYSDIIISKERLDKLPENGELPDIETIQYDDNTQHVNDQGPAPEQVNPGDIDGETYSGVPLQDEIHDVRQKVQDVVEEVLGQKRDDISINRTKNSYNSMANS